MCTEERSIHPTFDVQAVWAPFPTLKKGKEPLWSQATWNPSTTENAMRLCFAYVHVWDEARFE